MKEDRTWDAVATALIVILALSAFMLVTDGCSLARYTHTTESVAGAELPDDPCDSIDDVYMGWTITAGIAGAGATATTIAAAAITDHDAIVGLGISSAALAAIATAAGFIAAEYAARYEACRNESGEW